MSETQDGEHAATPVTRQLTGRKQALVGALWNAAQTGLPLAATATLSIVVGRVLGPELLGVQSLIAYSEAVLAGLLVMSMEVASIQMMSAALGANDKQRAQRYASWVMAGQFVNGLISASILIAVGFTSTQPWAWYLAGLTALVNAVGWGYAARIIAYSGSWALVARRRLWTQLLAQFGAAVAVLLGAGLTALFAANLLGAILLVAMIRPAAGKISLRLRSFPRELARLNALFMLRQFLQQVVAQRVEFLFLAIYSVPEQIAMYSIPFMVVSSAVLLPTAIISAGMPAMAAREAAGQHEEVAAHLGFALRVTVAVSVPLSFAVAALGPRLVVVLYGVEYAEAGQLLMWLAPLLLVMPAAIVCETYWYGSAKMRLPLRAAAVAGVVDIAACFALIPTFEAQGAAWANLIGQGVFAALLLTATHRRRPTIRLAWRRTTLSVVAMAVVAALSWWVVSLWPGVLGLLAGSLVMGAGVLAYGRLVGLLNGADATWLKTMVPRKLVPVLSWLDGGA